MEGECWGWGVREGRCLYGNGFLDISCARLRLFDEKERVGEIKGERRDG